MLARRLLVIALLVGALGVVLAGCGGGDNNNKSTSSGANASLVEQCKQQAAKVTNESARNKAEAACNRLSTVSVPSTPTTTTGGASRVQECLNFVKQIPNETARKRAEAACQRAG